jgi:hypothetical protein
VRFTVYSACLLEEFVKNPWGSLEPPRGKGDKSRKKKTILKNDNIREVL